MKINRYPNSEWHKRILYTHKHKNMFSSQKNYFESVLPCVLYVLENTTFEINFQENNVEFCLKTAKINNLQTVQNFAPNQFQLKNLVANHIEGYLLQEALLSVKNDDEYAQMMLKNFKEMLTEAVLRNKEKSTKTLSKDEMKILAKNIEKAGELDRKIEYISKNSEKIK